MNICGHRGASGYAPENTLEAFALAAEQGVTGSLDVLDGEAGLAEGIERLRDLVAAGEHLHLPARRARVT